MCINKSGRNGQGIFTEKSDVSTVENGRDEMNGAIFRYYELDARSRLISGGRCVHESSRYNMNFSVAYNSILQYPNSYIRVKGELFYALDSRWIDNRSSDEIDLIVAF